MSKKEKALYQDVSQKLSQLGVWRIIPDVMGISMLWASTRKVSADQIVCKYLLELEAVARENFVKGKK